MIKRLADFTCIGTRMRCGHLTLAVSLKQGLSEGSLQQLNLATYRTVGQVQLAGRFGIAARTGGDFKNAQGVQWGKLVRHM